MKKATIIFILLLSFVGLLGFNTLALPAANSHSTLSSHDQKMQWFRDAHFGVMICFGLYSQYGGIWKGEEKKINGCAAWMMYAAHAPRLEYARAAKDLNPSKFNADTWIRAVRDAGAKYIVIITKHHEGFAIFKTKASSYNIVDATPFKRDMLKEVAESCKKYGIKLGIYYSQNYDWYHPGGGGCGWDPTQRGDSNAYVEKIVIPQIRELLTNYGKVDIFWYDIPGGVVTLEQAKRIDAMVHKLQPDIIVNNRLRPEIPYDILTPEQFIPSTGIPGADWETCMTMNWSWGYAKLDHQWKSAQKMIRMLCDATSKGGNFLLNIGPDAEGVIPQPSLDRFNVIGKWLQKNGEAIYGTRASLFPQQPAWGRFTTRREEKESTIYALVFMPPSDLKIRMPGLLSPILSAHILGENQALEIGKEPNDIPYVRLQKSNASMTDFVVAIRVKGFPRISDNIYPNPKGGLLFLPRNAKCTQGLQINSSFLTGRPWHVPALCNWNNPQATATWKFYLMEKGPFTLTLSLSAPKESAGTKIEAVVDGIAHPVEIRSTGDWTQYTSFRAGDFDLSSGEHTLVLRLKELHGQSACNIAKAELFPKPKNKCLNQKQ